MISKKKKQSKNNIHQKSKKNNTHRKTEKKYVGGDNSDNFDIMPYLKPYGILDPEGKYPNPLTGKAYSETYFKFSIGKNMPDGFKGIWSKMPIYSDKNIFFNKLHKNNVLLVISTTGSGKTVLIPKFMLHYFDYNGQIAITIPKRELVKSAGGYAADTLDVKLGEHVGYVHGTEKNKYSPRRSNLIYMTEGILYAQLTGSDPDIRNYSGVIIDEAHERSTNVDMLLLLLKKLVFRRPEFKLIIMSATISINIFKDYYNVPGIKFDIFEPTQKETLFPIEHIYTKHIIPKISSNTELVKKVRQIAQETNDGHIIAFLSTKSEVDSLCKELKPDLEKLNKKTACLSYYSSSGEDSKGIVDSIGSDTLKDKYGLDRVIISATNMIESSFTVKGIKYVIDSGMEYKVYFDPDRNAKVRGKTYSTQSQITQRCGRTGRTNAGYCLKIYSATQFKKFVEFPKPNIVTENFTSILLDIMGLKITGNLVNSLNVVQEMIAAPEKNYLKHAINNLYYLGLMYKNGDLTYIGRCVRKFNTLIPEIALMILASVSTTALDCFQEVIIIAAMLSIESSLDGWVSEPDINNTNKYKTRTRESYLADLRRWSNEWNNYGDFFILLAIYNEYSRQPDSKKYMWCKQHGIKYDNIIKLDTHTASKIGVIDDIYNILNGIAIPNMFYKPVSTQSKSLTSEYKSLTKITKPIQTGGKKNKQKTNNQQPVSNPKQPVSNLKQQPAPNPKQQPVSNPKQPKITQEEKNKNIKNKLENYAQLIFTKYYVPVDGNLPSIPYTQNIEDEILACIYYGFHRNIGVYLEGGGKKYKSKSSTVDGSIKDSIYDILQLEPPKICLYYELDISESEYGKTSSTYKMVCNLPESLMNDFM